MVNIEPYEYQRKTNLKEHNDLVAKINEIVDVINNNNLDTILPKISKLETDVSTINATDSLQWTDIENLKTKNTEYDIHFGLNDTQIDEITKSLVSDVAILNGTTSGNVKVRIGLQDAPSIDSDDYNIQKPTSVELIQGSAPAMVKAQITLSDGTVLISDDFMFTTEAIGQDVYISSFVFKNGNVAGSISADIGLSNGSTLTANNFVVPTDPNVTSAITDLQSRVSAVEGGSVGGLDELKAQVQTNTTNIGTLTTDIDDLDIKKADQSNTNQEIVAGTITATNITKGGVNVATVNDIPVVPDISSKADKNNSNQTIVAGTVSATNITKGGVNVATVNDIPTSKIQKIALSKEGTGINGYLSPCIQYDKVVFATFAFDDDQELTTTLYNGSMTYYGNEDGYKEFVGSCYRAVSRGKHYEAVSFVFKIGSSSSFFVMIANNSTSTPYTETKTPRYAYANAFIERIIY